MIHFDGFGWRFARSAGWAVRGVSLAVDAGETVVIAGASGSGKTTLAMAACGLLMGRRAGEAEGRVVVDGCDVAATPLHEVAGRIGLVQQNPEMHFATPTVRDELAFGLENRCVPREEIRRRVDEALALLGIEPLRGRELGTLSGGEKQRVAVASILAGGPRAVVLDEPTASLDPRASRDLFHALAELARQRGLTVVIIEHKLAQLAALRPRLVWLDEGRVQADVRLGADATALPTGLRQALFLPAQAPPPARATQETALLAELAGVTVEAAGQAILRDVSLQVRAGEVVALMGPNGGGKTTLLHVLLGLAERVSGSVRVCGIEVTGRVASRLAPHVGVVFQNADHQLVAETVCDEAVYAARMLGRLDPPTTAWGEELLAVAGLAERRDAHPFALSWGQKRRLNLISAVLHQPKLLLLDEPFSGQDWEHVRFLLTVIRRMVEVSADERGGESTAESRGACVMVVHDPRVVLRVCTRVVFVEAGRIVVDAPVDAAFERIQALGHGAYVPDDLIEGWNRSASGTLPADRT
ncbi:MAG TPA: ATP-binding cassette domain-containing protein [Phycisphaerae bacterium]|nr:ATP-binding cassette domain-containing protein [Phycisphaerae bacterium]HNU44954.1 ATP-binding cassette domain-containing protein [Phycisphaerae bacterium]